MNKQIDLHEVFAQRQNELSARYDRVRTIQHPTGAGDEGEQAWEGVLRDFLPNRYSLGRGRFVVDSKGSVSEQQDIVVYDGQFSPTFLKLENISYIPVESVYAVIEVKPALSKATVKAAVQKASSVRSLTVIPGEFGTIGGGTGRHDPKGILAGLVCHTSDWRPPFGSTFHETVESMDSPAQLDFGCVVEAGAFSRKAGIVETAPPEKALIAFCLGLFHALQTKGNASAIDPLSYGADLWGSKNKT